MRKLCPNLDREDCLDTVLEVPIPEEAFSDSSPKNSAWHHVKSWVKPHGGGTGANKSPSSVFGGREMETQVLLGVAGAPLIPLPVHPDPCTNRDVKFNRIEFSMAKYIVQQYVAATGGEKALNSIGSIYALGKVKMIVSEFISGEGLGLGGFNGNGNGKVMKIKSMKSGAGEMGAFVMWQKKPELWSLELVLSGYKITAGSDGKVAWRQTPWHHSHASRGPPRPVRRSLQGLDPLSTANLFFNSICIGEKTVNNEDCFVLKLEAASSILKARSSSSVEVIRHTVWGYFSQRTGLLVQLEDSQLIRIRGSSGNDSVFWETTMESLVQDYSWVDGINVAHSGRTAVTLNRMGEGSDGHSRTRMEEAWTIEEVDFNVKGLSMDCFLPPGDLKREDDADCESAIDGGSMPPENVRLPLEIWINTSKVGVAKVVAIDEDFDGLENIEMH